MKRTALARRTPLVARTPLRRTALSPASPKHTRTVSRPKRAVGIPAKVRAALRLRSGGMCEIAAPGCDGRAVDASHRISVKMGGRRGAAAARHHVLSGLMAACRGCHSLIHSQPAHAYWKGWALREHEIPSEVPVLRRGHWVLLLDDGSVLPTNKTTADMKEAS